MINSFVTGKPTEAGGSGRGTGKRTEAASAVRLFGLFGLLLRNRCLTIVTDLVAVCVYVTVSTGIVTTGREREDGNEHKHCNEQSK